MNELIFFDNAATTKLPKPAFDAMLSFLGDGFGNPSDVAVAVNKSYNITKEKR